MIGSATTQVQNIEQCSESNNLSLDPVSARNSLVPDLLAGKGPSVLIEINPGFCRHYSKGFCKRKDACLFSHSQENCQNYGYNKTCEDNKCPDRHPKLCKHFIKARCFFGKNCLFLHPPDPDFVRMQSKISELQVKLDRMTFGLSSMEEKFMEKGKAKTTN